MTSSDNPVACDDEVTFTATLDVAAPANLDWFDGPQGSVQLTVAGQPLGPPVPLDGDDEIDMTMTAPTVPRSARVGISYSGDENSKPSSASLVQLFGSGTGLS